MKKYYITNDRAILAHTYTKTNYYLGNCDLCFGYDSEDATKLLLFLRADDEPVYLGQTNDDLDTPYDFENSQFELSDGIIEEIEDEIDEFKNRIEIYKNELIKETTEHWNDLGDVNITWVATDEAYPDDAIDNATRTDGWLRWKMPIVTETGLYGYAYATFANYDDCGEEIDGDNHDWFNADYDIRIMN